MDERQTKYLQRNYQAIVAYYLFIITKIPQICWAPRSRGVIVFIFNKGSGVI